MSRIKAEASKPKRQRSYAAKRAPSPDGMSDLERAYSLELDRLKSLGLIRSWMLHPVKLRIVEPTDHAWPLDLTTHDPAEIPDEFAAFASGKVKQVREAFYIPDFRVIGNDGTWSFHETKGFLQTGGDHALGYLKFKLAVSLHPHPFFMVQAARKHVKDKVLIVDEWDIQRYGR